GLAPGRLLAARARLVLARGLELARFLVVAAIRPGTGTGFNPDRGVQCRDRRRPATDSRAATRAVSGARHSRRAGSRLVASLALSDLSIGIGRRGRGVRTDRLCRWPARPGPGRLRGGDPPSAGRGGAALQRGCRPLPTRAL